MPRTLYSPRLEDGLVRRLYRAALSRRMPMTRLLDEIVTGALSADKPSTENGSPDTSHPQPDPARLRTPLTPALVHETLPPRYHYGKPTRQPTATA